MNTTAPSPTEPSVKEAAIAKIVKLLRLSKSSNQHEAELAAKKASDLMAEYQISASSLERDDISSGVDGVIRSRYEVRDLKMKLIWVETLAYAAAKLYDGFVLVGRGLHGTEFTFVGFKSEIPIMAATFEHLYEAWKGFVERDLQTAKDEHDDYTSGPWQPKHTMKFKHGHGQGYGEALFVRCTEIARQRKVKVSAESASCTTLVVVRDQAIDLWRRQNRVKSVTRNQTAGSSAGHGYGAAAGRSVAIGGTLK